MLLFLILLFISQLIKRRFFNKIFQKNKNLHSANSIARIRKRKYYSHSIVYTSCSLESFAADNLADTEDESLSINDNEPKESKLVFLPPPRITQIPQKIKINH